jgi:hypothetical protein
MSPEEFREARNKFIKAAETFVSDLVDRVFKDSQQETDEVYYKKSDFLGDHPDADRCRKIATTCSASSIQAMTDISLVGRVLAIFGRGLGIRLYRYLELLSRPRKRSTKKSHKIFCKLTK